MGQASENYFILAGNGPYQNHGCEAIVRGSVSIIDKYYKNTKYAVGTYIADEKSFLIQKNQEINRSIEHFEHPVLKRYSTDWFLYNFIDLFYKEKKKYYNFKNMSQYMQNAKAILSIGGDNYSLDYGFPVKFINLDDYCFKQDKPLIIWGASVGPFTKDKECENFMKEHLKKVTAIFAREPMTVEYLDGIGIRDNVYRVCDPAFWLEPEKVDGLNIIKNSIGINISPIMDRCISNVYSNTFVELTAKIISKLLKETDKSIYMIPHVVIHGDSDYTLMKNIIDKIDDDLKSKVTLINDTYNAAQYKWIISQMEVFFGARTHATIAAFSSLVPTLSFVYSMKSVGINNDLFGNEEFCICADEFNEDIFTWKIEQLIKREYEVKKLLSNRLVTAKKMSLKAGEYLKDITG